ncbi:MAG: protein-L-isoaspartate O-methyltransferase, partial [Gammaproteobacteria bacterium]|nr:protein-L-isoaspartate O-methyltransferase [Gammaproteobacteria bacterium]
MTPGHLGIGMTSQRTRERLVQRLRDEGIRDRQVLDCMRNTPRHLFVDEAL